MTNYSRGRPLSVCGYPLFLEAVKPMWYSFVPDLGSSVACVHVFSKSGKSLCLIKNDGEVSEIEQQNKSYSNVHHLHLKL